MRLFSCFTLSMATLRAGGGPEEHVSPRETRRGAEGRAGGLVREAKDPLTVRSENYTHFGFTAPDRDISVFSARIAGDPKFAGREAFR